MKILAAAFCAALSFVSVSHAQTIVFNDDFSSSAIKKSGNPYVGGWFEPQLGFQKWTSSDNASISSGALTINSTSATRSAGIVISPSLFDGAGDYVLTFDLKDYTGDSNDSAIATIWAGSGYDLSFKSGNALIVDTYSASLSQSGTAVTQQLASTYLNESSNGNQMTFSYDGTSAVAVFLGVKTEGYPFPSATYDNVSITKASVAAVPEPNVAMLLGIAGTCVLLARRRNR
ncbi:PEP-CTERM sorting domain-containing protein [Luteolibacter sp. AS25]|uniref:PEP-CTERM sorting domain-containing protein n=1 Tax=Luteolibacter sp. AS25 TaxID=3135776 RepID=UPI00398AA83E